MRVFVTGLSGFIGSHVARVLVAAGCEVLGLARPSASLWRLRDIEDELTVLRGDLSQIDSYQEALQQWQPQACIHLAWYAEPGQYLHSKKNLDSLQDSIDLFQFLTTTSCRTVVMAGTCAEYNTSLGGLLNEDSQTRPETLYAATKLSLALITEKLAEQFDINFSWARFFYLYGPYEDERRLIPSAIRTFLKGDRFPASQGQQIRDYLYIEDAANALMVLAKTNANGIFNIASQEPIAIADMLEKLENMIGQAGLLQLGKIPYRDWEPMCVCGDNTRLRTLGWQPRWGLEDGLQETIQYWRSVL